MIGTNCSTEPSKTDYKEFFFSKHWHFRDVKLWHMTQLHTQTHTHTHTRKIGIDGGKLWQFYRWGRNFLQLNETRIHSLKAKSPTALPAWSPSQALTAVSHTTRLSSKVSVITSPSLAFSHYTWSVKKPNISTQPLNSPLILHREEFFWNLITPIEVEWG